MKKNMWVLLIVACLVISFSSSLSSEKVIAEENDFWAVSYTTYDVTYDAILKMYVKVINGYKTKNYGRHDLFNEFMLWDYEDNISSVKNDIGFYIDDINHDGIDELVINSSGGYIYEVFTMDNERVRELIRGGGRYTCQRLNDGTFYRWAHGGAGHHDYEIWQMNGTGKVTFVNGYFMRPDNTYHNGEWYRTNKSARMHDVSGAKPVSASEAESWLNQQEENVLRHRFVPFAVYEKHADDPWDLGVLVKDNKSSGSAKIRIRKEPKEKAKVVETKRVGTYVKVLSKEEGYYHIKIGKKDGYVKEEFLIPVTWREEQQTEIVEEKDGSETLQ